MQVKLLTGLVGSLVAGLFATGAAFAQSNTPTAGGAPAAATQASPADKMARPYHDRGQQLEQLDKDKDGFISKAEAASHPMLAKRFDALDTNKDGKLSKEELQAARRGMHEKHRERAEAAFKAADKDGDGFVSRQEAEDAAREKVARMFDRLDTNKDGKLSLEEIRAGRDAGRGPGHQRKPAGGS